MEHDPKPWADHALQPVLDNIVQSIGLDARTRARAAAVCPAWAEAVHRLFPPWTFGLRLGCIPNPILRATYGPDDHPAMHVDENGFYYPEPTCGTVSPDFTRAAVCFATGHLTIYSTATGALIRQFEPTDIDMDGTYKDCVRFNRDGSLLLIGGSDCFNNDVQVVRVSDGELLWRFECDGLPETEVRGDFSVDFVAVSQVEDPDDIDHSVGIALYSIITGEWLRTIPTPDVVDMCHIRFSPDATQLATTAKRNSSLYVYNVATGALVWHCKPPQPHGNGSTPNALVWSPDGTRIATISDVDLCVWDMTTGLLHQTMGCPGISCDWSGDGRWLLTVSIWPHQVHLRVLDATTWRQHRFITLERAHHCSVCNAVFATLDGRAITLFGGCDETKPCPFAARVLMVPFQAR